MSAIAGAIIALLVLVAGAFGIGQSRGRTKAQQEAESQRAEEKAAGAEAAAARRVEVTKEASDVQQTVNHMPDSDVDSELRESWTRKS